MINIKILDYFGKELNENSLVKLIDDNEETYGDTSEIRVDLSEDKFSIKAFEKEYSCNLLYNYGNFKIVGEKK